MAVFRIAVIGGAAPLKYQWEQWSKPFLDLA